MNVLIVDNYDSFTYNLYQFAGELLEDRSGQFKLDVFRNDEIDLKGVESGAYDRIILSPGPGDPADPAYFGVCLDILKGPAQKTPVLGVCLGMQGMAYAYGGVVKRARLPMHGKTSLVSTDGLGVFRNLPQELSVMRYHSLIVEQESLPDCFIVTSRTQEAESELMGIRHVTYPMEGIQFHPESFATEAGMQMIANFLYP
ncbi:MAG: aminodeoxychorismate/anthranilate synthase component II [Leptospiraceae bacterium]